MNPKRVTKRNTGTAAVPSPLDAEISDALLDELLAGNGLRQDISQRLAKALRVSRNETRQLATAVRMQPIALDSDGIVRFRSNRVVCYLLEVARRQRIDLNELACVADAVKIPPEDWQQFMQLIGYSVSGYCDLSTVSDESKDAAFELAEKLVAQAGSGNLKP